MAKHVRQPADLRALLLNSCAFRPYPRTRAPVRTPRQHHQPGVSRALHARPAESGGRASGPRGGRPPWPDARSPAPGSRRIKLRNRSPCAICNTPAPRVAWPPPCSDAWERVVADGMRRPDRGEVAMKRPPFEWEKPSSVPNCERTQAIAPDRAGTAARRRHEASVLISGDEDRIKEGTAAVRSAGT